MTSNFKSLIDDHLPDFFDKVSRKIKIAVFPLTCRRQGRVGRSENLFIFHVFFFVENGYIM